jgi:HEAT repeat protein
MNAATTRLGRVLDELAQGATLSPRALQEFSDLDPGSLQSILQAWPGIPAKQKHVLLDRLHELANENTLVSFDDLARALLTDPDGQVRLLAIRLLQENDDPKLAPSFLKILSTDEEPETRREAASALGHFVELGELEQLPASVLRKVEDGLLEKVSGSDQTSVRRRALESLGYSSRPEVATLIQSSIRRENPDWQASALVAMGLSSDERWEDEVLARLQEDNLDVRLAAVEAAGELRLGAARPLLFQVLQEEDEDQVSSAAIWSLSQIGGEEVRLYIQNLLDAAEEGDAVAFLEEALENLDFTDELDRFDLLSVDPDIDPAE